jgi:hypothetical protein
MKTISICGYEVSIDDLKKWIAALRSGRYKQAKGFLNTDNGYYCCLGIGCELFIDEEQKRRNTIGNLFGRLPCDQPKSPEWLINFDHYFFIKTGEYISNYNDRGETFNEIADMIEELCIKPYEDDYKETV